VVRWLATGLNPQARHFGRALPNRNKKACEVQGIKNNQMFCDNIKLKGVESFLYYIYSYVVYYYEK
jgi:hypothetical protein